MVIARLKKHGLSFKYAFKGIYFLFKTQSNLYIHLFFAFAATGLALYFSISKVEWLLLVLTISLVLVAEALNTSIEIVTDALKVHKKDEKDDYYIMVAKDVGAGAVLISAVGSVMVGIIIFGSRLIGVFSTLGF